MAEALGGSKRHCHQTWLSLRGSTAAVQQRGILVNFRPVQEGLKSKGTSLRPFNVRTHTPVDVC